MIVDDLRQEELDSGVVECSARVRWADGDERLRVRAPSGFAKPPGDASAYLAAALPLAMRRGEALEIGGTVSPRLLARADLIQSIYTLWNPWLCRVRVWASGAADPGDGGGAVATFFSRGVDSSYTATSERYGAPELTHLLFVDGLDLRHNDTVRAEEVRLARAAASVIGLPLVAVSTNVRELSEPLCDWEDMAGAGLSFVALSLGGLLERAVIPPSDTYMSMTPCGTSPLLDPLFSTERVEIEHDRLEGTRASKVASIARRRPELLRYLKVCFAENRPDNCGRCHKCLLTMVALQAAGALSQAEGFPDEIDRETLRSVRVGASWFSSRYEIAAACRALPADGPTAETRRVLLDVLEDRGDWLDPYDRTPGETFRVHHARTVLSLARDGRPYPPLDGATGRPRPECSASLGLVRAVDPVGGRHLYGVGAAPPGRVVEELGSLSEAPSPHCTPAWLTPEGYLVTRDYQPAAARPSPLLAARWTLAPLFWRGLAPLPARARTAGWRLRRLLAGRQPRASSLGGEPVGYLHREGGPERRPLYSAAHPVTGDQLLSISPSQAGDLGYGVVVLLGYLDALVPVTGGLRSDQPRALPWASHWGLSAR